MEDKEYLITVLYNDTEIIRLPAVAKSTEDLRQKYIQMLTGITLQEGITIKVYQRIDDEWEIVSEHLF